MEHDTLVISHDIQELPDKGTAIYIDKSGEIWEFYNGKIVGRTILRDEEDTLLLK